MMHSTFVIENTTYLIKSENCQQAVFPRLVDRVQKELIRYGNKAAAEMGGNTATVVVDTSICQRNVTYTLTINPVGIK